MPRFLLLSCALVACSGAEGNDVPQPGASSGGTSGAGGGAPAAAGGGAFGGGGFDSGNAGAGSSAVGGSVAIGGGGAQGGAQTVGGAAAGAATSGGVTSGGATSGGGASGGATSGGGASGGTAGAAAGTGPNGGSSGAGGAPGQPSLNVIGFAATASKGLSTTTGGGQASPNLVTDCKTLASYLSDAQSRVIEIPSGTTLDCRTAPRTQQACELQCSAAAASPVYWRVPVAGYTCTTLADLNGDGKLDVPAGKLVDKSRNEISIKVGSNKTLRGLGSGATLKGVSLDIENQSNIIIQNLKITEINPDLVEAGDGVTINGSHHVWVDHCELSMISDGFIDIRYASSAVTVSNTHIVGKNPFVCGGQHNYVSLVSDSQVTFSRDYFDHSGGRNPKVAGDSQVHVHSSYYEGISYFCASAAAGSQVLIEGNYYLDSRYPHWAEGGSIEATGNRYAGTTSSDHRDNNAKVFNPPYAYTLSDVAALPQAVPAAVGLGKL